MDDVKHAPLRTDSDDDGDEDPVKYSFKIMYINSGTVYMYHVK